MNWQSVDIGQVIFIHQLIIKRAGTKAGIRDFALLHSALERPKATYDGQDLYPGIFIKAASLLQSLCLNHTFTDGNKRTAWTIAHKFLWDNGYHLKSTRMDASDFMVYVDNKKPELKEIASWLKSNSEKMIPDFALFNKIATTSVKYDATKAVREERGKDFWD